jgi:hypothetical protein
LGKAIITCAQKEAVFLSVYQAGDLAQILANGNWVHSLILDGNNIPLEAPFSLKANGSFVNALFMLTSGQIAAIAKAKSIGHAMQTAYNAPTYIGYTVDVDNRSLPRVRSYLGNCLKGN